MVKKTRKLKKRGGQVVMNIQYPSFSLMNNSTTTIKATEEEPTIVLPSIPLTTLIMHDPNSSQPSWLHWLITNIPNGDIIKGSVIVPYNGPSPPPGTGVHNYKFELYKQRNQINISSLERNHFSPSDFMNENGLTFLKRKSFKVNT